MISRSRRIWIPFALLVLVASSLTGCQSASGKWFGVITVHDPQTGEELTSTTLMAGTRSRVFDLYLVDATIVMSGVDAHLAVVGHTNDAVAGTTTIGQRDVIVALYAYDADSVELERVWVQRIGTAQRDEAVSIVADDQGSIYVLGWTQGSFVGSSEERLRDAFVAKYDTNGERQWLEQFGTNHEDTPLAIAAAPAFDGTVAVVGSTMGDFDDENLEAARSYPHGFIWSLNDLTEPRVATVRQVRADAHTVVNTIAHDSFQGPYIIAGETEAWLGADGGSNDGGTEGFVWRLDSAFEPSEKRQIVGEEGSPYVRTFGLHADGSLHPLTLLAETNRSIFVERNPLSDTVSERTTVHNRRPNDSDMASDGTIWFVGADFQDGVYGYLKQALRVGADASSVVEVDLSVHVKGVAVSRDGTLLVTVGDDRCLALCPEVD